METSQNKNYVKLYTDKRKDKTTIHLFVDKQIMKNFEAAYPRCRSRFLENALALATKDKIFFDKIFFKDMLNHD